MIKTVYTAGAMEHITDDQMTGWRNRVELELPDHKFYHPTRRAAIHKEEYSIETYNKLHRIVAQDLEDIKKSDIILANIKDSEPGRKWGTVMEMALAWEWDKVVIAVVDIDQFKHPFVYTMCTEVHYNLEDAIEAVRMY